MQYTLIKKNKGPVSNRSTRGGFTLVETLVAIGILSISILATFTAVQGGLRVSSVSKDQMVAFYLTQEVMEYIKNIRDENVLSSLGTTATINWLNGIANTGDACASNQVCEIDSPAKTVSVCVGGAANCRYLAINSTNGLWGYTAGTNTVFKRAIQVQTVSADEARVTVTISWTASGGLAKSFQVSESLFNRK